MIKRSFRSKLILHFVCSVVFVMLMLIAATNFIFRPILIHDTRNSMHGISTMISEAYESGSSTISKLIHKFDTMQDIEIVLYDSDYEIISSYEALYPDSSRITMLKEWMEVYEEKAKSDGSFFDEFEDKSIDFLTRAVYITRMSDGTYMCMSKVVKSIEQFVDIATLSITVGAIFVILVGTAIWYILTNSFIVQLKKMSAVTKNMAQLNFDEKIDYHSADEVGILAESIDEMSDELKRSIEKLRKDVERRQRLIRDISHELKTPVTTVSGYTENIQILVPDNPRVQKYCSIMLEECDVINNLVQELLYMSKIEDEAFECNKEIFPVEKLKNKILSKIENEFTGESVQFNLCDADISADINLMERAVYNYITNAIKHKPEGSRVIVNGYKEDDGYVFAVTNKGTQITAEEKESIWDVFYKRDQARTRSDGGHGIGLAIVKRIADLHGGKVDLISENGENTFFIKV